MGAGKSIAKLTAIAAAIGGAIFFWRKTHPHDEAAPSPAFPPAADTQGDDA
jgi:hypothetical protein